MAGESVLIAAFSARALAQSAQRAGYVPLVVDAFGDLDTRAAAAAVRVVADAMATGFRTKPLIAALDELAASAPTKPVGLVLGSGFEDKPRLVETLAKRFRLLGAARDTYEACKRPGQFFAILDRLGIAHPETSEMPPSEAAGWISKRIGGSGGRHIRICSGAQRARPRRYFQRMLSGDRVSVSGICAGAASILLPTRQWIAPSASAPFRFGGAVSCPALDPRREADLIRSATAVAEALGLAGMASFDFLVDGGRPHLLEVNPRPGASLDVLDDLSGTLFAAHIDAASDRALTPSYRAPQQATAMAILHADRGALTLGDVPWPDWSADRGAPGTTISRGAPLATALAQAPTADAAEALARARLAELEDLIYGHAQLSRHGAP